jgi:energy-coupling factor transporter ATP-binding protein EcfA2
MSKSLILNSLEIRRFRCFRELRIGRLGRVNLVIGKNNVGKSTLLEALRLFASPSSLAEIIEILASRNEIFPVELDGWKRDNSHPIQVDSLFFGRRVTPGDEGEVLIGPADLPEQTLRVSIEKRERTYKAHDARYLEVGKPPGADTPYFVIFSRDTALTFRIGASSLSFMIEKPTGYAVPPGAGAEGMVVDPIAPVAAPLRTIPFYSIGPNGIGLTDVGKLWDQVSLSPLERDVIDALRIISPEVDRVALKSSRDGSNGDILSRDAATRIPFVKIESLEEPIPLRALGDGVNRLFGIALAIVHAKDGILLVDEIENGVHYSVQTDLWRLVFEMAARLNVQVFATTHSYDCIKTFEGAARESEQEGVMIRLARKGDRTLIGEFDESELAIAVEGRIEVR